MTEEKREERVESTPVSGKQSRQSLFGTLLFWIMLLMAGALLGGVAWGGYLSWHFTKNQAALPSIAGLPQGSEAPSAPEVRIEAAPEVMSEPETGEDEVKKAKNIDIQALNGGAIKGSAATTVEALKKEGYTKVTAGNTVNNYTGVVIYYTVGHDNEASVVKKSLLKLYPKAETKPALKENKETAMGSITVILGK